MKTHISIFFLSFTLLFSCNKSNRLESQVGKYLPSHGVAYNVLLPLKTQNKWNYKVVNYQNGLPDTLPLKEQFNSYYKYVDKGDTFFYFRFQTDNFNDTPVLGKNYLIAYRNIDDNQVQGITYTGERFTFFNSDPTSPYYLGSYTLPKQGKNCQITRIVGLKDYNGFQCYYFVVSEESLVSGKASRQYDYYVSRGIGIVGIEIREKDLSGTQYQLIEKWTLVDYYFL